MSLDLPLPPVSSSVLDEFLFNATAATQTWRIVGRGHKLSTRQIQLTFAGSLLRKPQTDRKSTRLNSSHTVISYAVFCLKKKKNIPHQTMIAIPCFVFCCVKMKPTAKELTTLK